MIDMSILLGLSLLFHGCATVAHKPSLIDGTLAAPLLMEESLHFDLRDPLTHNKNMTRALPSRGKSHVPLDAFCPDAHNGTVITKNHPTSSVGKELYSALWKKEKAA